MKTIYTFTFDCDSELIDRFNSNLRLIAYMLYEYIYNYYGDDRNPLVIHDGIERNNLISGEYFKEYRLDSDKNGDDGVDYEPFIIDNNTFGLTIRDDSFDINIIVKLLEEILRLLGVDYKYTINSSVYYARDIFDESNRDGALKFLYNKLGFKYRKNKFISMIMRCGKNSRKSSRRR